MSDQTTLYEIRRELGRRMQPRHNSGLQELDHLIRSDNPHRPHPYELPDQILSALSDNAIFSRGSDGLQAHPPGKAFLYRLCSIRSVVGFTAWQSNSFGAERDQDIFERLVNDYQDKGDWLYLGDYAINGDLKGFMGLTWWTSLDLGTIDDAQVPLAAQKLGVVLLGQYKLILRCSVTYVSDTALARVPTVLDAFIGEVFHTTKDTDGPHAGVTISLESNSVLSEGSDEFVIGVVTASQVQMRPVHLTEELRRSSTKCLDTDRWRLLEAYYKKQKERCLSVE